MQSIGEGMEGSMMHVCFFVKVVCAHTLLHLEFWVSPSPHWENMGGIQISTSHPEKLTQQLIHLICSNFLQIIKTLIPDPPKKNTGKIISKNIPALRTRTHNDGAKVVNFGSPDPPSLCKVKFGT